MALSSDAAPVGDETNVARRAPPAGRRRGPALPPPFDAADGRRLLVRRGRAAYLRGQPFETIALVTDGAFKALPGGGRRRERPVGFTVSGETLGLDGIAEARYPTTQVALCDSVVVTAVLSRDGCKPADLVALLCREIARDRALLAFLNRPGAIPRVAGFVMNIARRMGDARGPAGAFQLPMSRCEIGGFLGLTQESVSRALSALRRRGILAVSHRHVRILDASALVDVDAS